MFRFALIGHNFELLHFEILIYAIGGNDLKPGTSKQTI